MKAIIAGWRRIVPGKSYAADTGGEVSSPPFQGHSATGAVLGWLQRLLLTAGVLMLGYCGFVLMDAWRFERQENGRLERIATTADMDQSAAGSTATRESNGTKVGDGGLIGKIQIQRLGLSAVLLEGTTNKTLRRAVGHIRGTALPGQPGNAGIAGHRDRFFRPLRNVQTGDIIALTTLAGKYQYRVLSAKVVGPTDVSVLDSDGSEVLTLVTCYPFYFVGSAPDRFIVRAERVTD